MGWDDRPAVRLHRFVRRTQAKLVFAMLGLFWMVVLGGLLWLVYWLATM